MSSTQLPTEIEFNRPRKYRTIRVLDGGACAQTALVHDDDMGIDLVIKKYQPIVSAKDEPRFYRELLDRFRDEAKILFKVNHPNIVRVFNFFDYREANTSYIVMEFVEGDDILSFLSKNAIDCEKVFEKLISGFAHLEGRGILHRDIRPMNILVTAGGDPKIIDFGFGKVVDGIERNESKSISLNWWCDPPPEFSESLYDFQTEVYFLGKLFEQAIQANSLSDFKYLNLVRKMCEPSRASRFASFSEINKSIIGGKFRNIDFSENEIEIYRDFSHELFHHFSEIDQNAKYCSNSDEVISSLGHLHKACMLEEFLPAPNKLGRIFVLGAFKWWTGTDIRVAHLTSFLEMLRGLPGEKRNIVIQNLLGRLDGVKRSSPFDDDDEIPF